MSINKDFLDYGIRTPDLNLIEGFCQKEDINFEWLKECIFKPFHREKLESMDVPDKKIDTILNKALDQLQKLDADNKN